MTPRWVWPVVDAALNAVADVLNAVGDGIDLAARTLCPMDHTPPNPLQPEQCGCGAGYATAAECPWCSPPPADDEPLTEQELVAVRNLMAACDGISFATLRQIIQERGVYPCPNHDACGYAGLCLSAEHCQIAELNQTPRAEGTQCADSSGGVGGHESPSPERRNELPLFKCGAPSCFCETDDRYLPVTGTPVAPPLNQSVSQEVLAAYISDLCIETATTYDLAGALLAKFQITK